MLLIVLGCRSCSLRRTCCMPNSFVGIGACWAPSVNLQLGSESLVSPSLKMSLASFFRSCSIESTSRKLITLLSVVSLYRATESLTTDSRHLSDFVICGSVLSRGLCFQQSCVRQSIVFLGSVVLTALSRVR